MAEMPTAVVSLETETSKPLTIGRIAIGVFLGNLLSAVLIGGLWFLATHS